MSFDVLNRNLNIFTRHFLEASAGTGKTFAIEHLVTRLVLEGKSPFSIEQILVVTFTRAATRELKKRIRSNLCRAKEELLSGSSTDYLKAICEKGEKEIKDAIDRIEATLINYDAAQIYTLHGFCHLILNEFAFEADVGFEISNPEEQEHLFLLEKMVKDYLKEEAVVPQYSPTQIKVLLGRYRGDFRKMISSLVDAINNSKQIVSIPNFAELHELFIKEIHSLPVIEKARFKSDIDTLRPLFKKMNAEVLSQVDLLGEILESKKCDFVKFDRLLTGEFFLKKMGPEQLKVRAKIPDTLYYPGLLENLRSSLLPLIERAKDSSAIFLRLVCDLKERSQVLLEKKEKFSPDDLLLKVQLAAESSRFVECIQKKYRAAIIDEFQDTDPIQWNIFKKLFLAQMEVICLVGDPKQSIYAFRNADVYTYLDAAKTMGNSAKKFLDTNYRSTPALVEALNLLFSRVQGNWMTPSHHAEALQVLPVKSGAACLASDSETPLQFFIVADKKGRSQKFPTSEMLKKKISPFIASEIFSLHCKKGVEYHDIAILVKDRYMAKEIVDFLKASGIPACSKRGAAITDSIAYFALKELLSAVCSPNDMSKIKAALGGPLFAWDCEQICKGLEDISLLQAKAQMQSLYHILFEKGFGVFFQTLLNTRWGESHFTLLEEILHRGELSLYLDLRKLAELIIEETMLRDLKGSSYLGFLEQIAIESNRDDCRLRTASHEEKGSVMVMTIHMSKGLEFDTVFALGVASRHKSSEQIAIKKNGCTLTTIFDVEDSACQKALEEQDSEKMRQLYVALTRAKKRLYVPLIVDEEQKSIEIGGASAIELFFARLDQNPIHRMCISHSELYHSAQSLNRNRAMQILDTFSPQIQYSILEEMPQISFIQATSAVELVMPSPLNFPSYNELLFSFTALAKKDHLENSSLERRIFFSVEGGRSSAPEKTDSSANPPLKGQDCAPSVPFNEVSKPILGAPLSPHSMPAGSEIGQLLHLIFEKIFKRCLHHPFDENALATLIAEEVAFSPLEEWIPVILPWIVELLKKKLAHFSLADVPGNQLQQEMEFFFPISKGMMKGFCDLLFEFDNKYYLLDWKSNYLGPDDSDYTQEKMTQVMHNNDYFLQASIYSAALERYVKLFDNRPFSECFGGAIYYFIRGKAIYHFTPESYKDL